MNFAGATSFSSALMPIQFPPPSLSTGNSVNELLLSHVNALENKLAFYTKSDQANRSSSFLHNILRDAHRDPAHAAHRILDLVRHVNPPHPLILRIAKLCLTGPVGRVGERRSLRAVAMKLLDHVLNKEKNVQAMCLRGEILTPAEQGGYNDPFTPRLVLQEAHLMFQLASASGDATALFLQGRWLMLNEPLHRKKSQVEEGRKLILQAIDLGCARAMNFLAETLDKADYESKDDVSNELGLFIQRLPINARGTNKGSRLQRERYIFNLYVQSSKLGDASAMNDMGACFSAGYAGLEKDFDLATSFYKASIKQGSNIAYDNLGTHFETGMDGTFPEKIDRAQALKYYRDGARERVPKCAYYLALCYEEGIPGILTKDVDRALRYYKHALMLADDHYDIHTAQQAIRNICQLYFTQIKLTNYPKSKETKFRMREVRFIIRDKETVMRSIDGLNQAISTALRSRSGRVPQLVQTLGDSNAQAVMKHAKEIERSLKTDAQKKHLALYKFIVGMPYFGGGTGKSVATSTKVKRTNVTRPTVSLRSDRKRRKVSG